MSYPVTPGSPMMQYCFVSCSSLLLSRGETSSGSRPPGFSNGISTPTTPIHGNGRQFSPISVLRIPLDPQVDSAMSEEDPSEEVQPEMEGQLGPIQAAVDVPAMDAVNGPVGALPDILAEAPAPNNALPGLGQMFFGEMDDEQLLDMVRVTGFIVPYDVEVREDIVSRLRQLDQP